MKKRILFVDDEQCVLNGFRRVLYDHCDIWEMRYVCSVDAALSLLEETAIDVIISDVNMPGKDGFEFLKILQKSEKTKYIPVIILTGKRESNSKRCALESGAMDLLSKPVDREDLLARIYSMLRLKSYHDNLEQKVKERTSELEYSRIDIICRLGNLAEFRDQDTGNHILRVALYCKAIADHLGLGKEFVETLFMTSPLHDIGKVSIPDYILLKPDKLNYEEMEIMKQHCVTGARVFYQDSKIMNIFLQWRKNSLQIEEMSGKNPFQEMAASIALTHHERWDGQGYPEGLAGKDIPLESRIVALADVYDALSSVRPYKPAFSESKVMSVMHGNVDKHFDPWIYNAFMDALPEMREIKAQFADKNVKIKTLNRYALTAT